VTLRCPRPNLRLVRIGRIHRIIGCSAVGGGVTRPRAGWWRGGAACWGTFFPTGPICCASSTCALALGLGVFFLACLLKNMVSPNSLSAIIFIKGLSRCFLQHITCSFPSFHALKTAAPSFGASPFLKIFVSKQQFLTKFCCRLALQQQAVSKRPAAWHAVLSLAMKMSSQNTWPWPCSTPQSKRRQPMLRTKKTPGLGAISRSKRDRRCCEE
jgi:hypothetical protein